MVQIFPSEIPGDRGNWIIHIWQEDHTFLPRKLLRSLRSFLIPRHCTRSMTSAMGLNLHSYLVRKWVAFQCQKQLPSCDRWYMVEKRRITFAAGIAYPKMPYNVDSLNPCRFSTAGSFGESRAEAAARCIQPSRISRHAYHPKLKMIWPGWPQHKMIPARHGHLQRQDTWTAWLLQEFISLWPSLPLFDPRRNRNRSFITSLIYHPSSEGTIEITHAKDFVYLNPLDAYLPLTGQGFKLQLIRQQ
jgi:hypothetical protein